MKASTVTRWLVATVMAVAAAMLVAGTSLAAAAQDVSASAAVPRKDCPTGNCSPLP